MGYFEVCKQQTPFAISRANFFLQSQVILICISCSKLQREPLAQYSRTIQRLGDLVHAPKNRTMFGCLITSMTAHSFLNSSNLSCSMSSRLISLIATTVCFHLPLYTIPQPPSDSFLSYVSSLKGISLFQTNALASFEWYYPFAFYQC